MNIENLKSKLIYNQETGIFTWAKSQGAAKAGVIAGALHKQGYWVIGFESKIYSAHRLAWAITSGELPQISNANTRSSANKICGFVAAAGNWLSVIHGARLSEFGACRLNGPQALRGGG